MAVETRSFTQPYLYDFALITNFTRTSSDRPTAKCRDFSTEGNGEAGGEATAYGGANRRCIGQVRRREKERKNRQ